MKKSIAKKWVAALRSGKYRQTKHRLANGKGGFCCLGVLCDLHAQAHPRIAANQIDPTSYMGDEESLPMAVMDWADIATANGAFGNYECLAAANDGGKRFSTIAKLIEENVENL